MVHRGEGERAFRGGERMQCRIRARSRDVPRDGFPFRAQKFVDVYCSIFRDVISTSKGVRRAGSAALDLAYTAAGVFRRLLRAASGAVGHRRGRGCSREAGGVVTDFSAESSSGSGKHRRCTSGRAS